MNTLRYYPSKPSLMRLVWIIGALLLVPFVATLLHDEVNWKFGDYVVAALLLGFCGITIMSLRNLSYSRPMRYAMSTVILVFTLAIWGLLATA